MKKLTTLRLPHGETDPSKVYRMPDPDALIADYESAYMWRSYPPSLRCMSRDRTRAPGWDRIEAATWQLVVERLPRPLLREEAAHDLRHFDGQVRIGAVARIPGWPTLAERWGWTKHAVCALVGNADAWTDPHRASDVARTSTGHAPDAERTPRDGPTPKKQQKPDVDRTSTGRASDADRTSGGRAGARVERAGAGARITDPPIHRSTDPQPENARARDPQPAPPDPAFVPGPGSDPAVQRVWFQARQWCDALSERPPLPAAQAIRARIHEAGADAVLEVAEWVYRGPDPWWREHNPSPASFLRPSHFAALAPKARAWVASGRPRAGPAPPRRGQQPDLATLFDALPPDDPDPGAQHGQPESDQRFDPVAHGERAPGRAVNA